MAHDVFISGSLKNRVIAESLCAGLEAEGIRCWTAPRDLPRGGNYGESILHALASCRVVVMVFSSCSNNSPAVQREMERARHRGLPILLFQLEDIPMSPGLQPLVASCPRVDAVRPPLGEAMARLASATRALLGGGEETPPPASSRSMKRLLPALACGAVVVAGLGFGVSALHSPQKPELATTTPVETGALKLELSVPDAGNAAADDPSGVHHLVGTQPDGSLKITASCAYLDAWNHGAALMPMTPGPQGFFHDRPLRLELKLLNGTAKAVSLTRAVAEVRHSDPVPQRLLVIETPRGNELRLVSVGAIEPGPVSFQIAVAGPEHALDDARLPAPITLELTNGVAMFPLTNVPASGEATAFGQLVMGEGPLRELHRFEIPLGRAAETSASLAGPSPADSTLTLRGQGGPYEIEGPLSRSIQPGEEHRLLLQLAAPVTSTHRLRLRLDYDDGSGSIKQLAGPWIEASLFVENEIR